MPDWLLIALCVIVVVPPPRLDPAIRIKKRQLSKGHER